MPLADWNIYGPGGQSIIDLDGSKRCELSGIKWMLWNGNPALVDCEIIADMKLYGSAGYNKGGLLLRSDLDADNCYRFEHRYRKGGDEYILWSVIGGIATQLVYVRSDVAWTAWVQTRFRIDNWQISVDEYYDSVWHQIILLEETNHIHASGYVGLSGTNSHQYGGILFDNVEISEKL